MTDRQLINLLRGLEFPLPEGQPDRWRERAKNMDMQSVTSFKTRDGTVVERLEDGVALRNAEGVLLTSLTAETARELARATRAWFPKASHE